MIHLKRLHRKIRRRILKSIKTWSILKDYNKNYVSYETYDYMPDYMLNWKMTYVGAGAYVKYSTLQHQPLFEYKRVYSYKPCKFRIIKRLFKLFFPRGVRDIEFKKAGSIHNGMPEHIQVHITEKIQGSLLLNGINAFLESLGYNFCTYFDTIINNNCVKIFQYDHPKYSIYNNVPEYLYCIDLQNKGEALINGLSYDSICCYTTYDCSEIQQAIRDGLTVYKIDTLKANTEFFGIQQQTTVYVDNIPADALSLYI